MILRTPFRLREYGRWAGVAVQSSDQLSAANWYFQS
jgi:hypothetical protein